MPQDMEKKPQERGERRERAAGDAPDASVEYRHMRHDQSVREDLRQEVLGAFGRHASGSWHITHPPFRYSEI